jgi:hypothetical protein
VKVMVAQRTVLVLVVFVLGVAAGGAAVHSWHHRADSLPVRRLEATVLVPLVDNDNKQIEPENWQDAVEPLVRGFGGATLGAPAEGRWVDGTGRLRREEVRPVVVSFEAHRLEEFRRAVHEVGRRLGQETMYVRFEEPRIELLPVKRDGGG